MWCKSLDDIDLLHSVTELWRIGPWTAWFPLQLIFVATPNQIHPYQTELTINKTKLHQKKLIHNKQNYTKPNQTWQFPTKFDLRKLAVVSRTDHHNFTCCPNLPTVRILLYAVVTAVILLSFEFIPSSAVFACPLCQKITRILPFKCTEAAGKSKLCLTMHPVYQYAHISWEDGR